MTAARQHLPAEILRCYYCKKRISFNYGKDLNINAISLGKGDKEKMIKFRPVAHNVREFLPLLQDYLEKDKGICLTYLFGSFASGKVRKLSDVDIAVLLNEKLEEEKCP